MFKAVVAVGGDRACCAWTYRGVPERLHLPHPRVTPELPALCHLLHRKGGLARKQTFYSAMHRQASGRGLSVEVVVTTRVPLALAAGSSPSARSLRQVRPALVGPRTVPTARHSLVWRERCWLRGALPDV